VDDTGRQGQAEGGSDRGNEYDTGRRGDGDNVFDDRATSTTRDDRRRHGTTDDDRATSSHDPRP